MENVVMEMVMEMVVEMVMMETAKSVKSVKTSKSAEGHHAAKGHARRVIHHTGIVICCWSNVFRHKKTFFHRVLLLYGLLYFMKGRFEWLQ